MFVTLSPGMRVVVDEGRESFVLELKPIYEGETETAQMFNKHNGWMYVGGEIVEEGAGREVGDFYEATLDQLVEVSG